MRLLSLVLLICCAISCASLHAHDDEREIPLSDVPAAARAAAEHAVPGIRLTEAEVEEEDGRLVYEIEGVANGKEYEIEVTADGEVLEIEEDDDDDD
ncbi:MAG: PepSY domain-containing protein [Planctomycetota bacterium]|jgi:uncharacterized membrane protein YkoI